MVDLQAGSLKALVAALNGHSGDGWVIRLAAKALGQICCGEDDGAEARKKLAMEVGKSAIGMDSQCSRLDDKSLER